MGVGEMGVGEMGVGEQGISQTMVWKTQRKCLKSCNFLLHTS